MHQYSPAEPLILATLLLVRSDETDSTGLLEALADESYRILVAASADEAMRVLAQDVVDVVLAYQPDEANGGEELLAAIRAAYPATIRILIARDEVASVATRALHSGCAHHWLRHPCETGELALALFNVLVQRSFLPPESEGVLPAAPVTVREIPIRRFRP
jgi:DNA-binding NarL/FixJ family response regulator